MSKRLSLPFTLRTSASARDINASSVHQNKRRSFANSKGTNNSMGVRRWVSLRKLGNGLGPGVPSEELVESWIVLVLGSRALGLLDEAESGGAKSLAESLRDGRVLVRLAHAVGGKRTKGMAGVRAK